MSISHAISQSLSGYLAETSPRAEEIDANSTALSEAYAEFVRLQLHKAGTPAFPLPGGSPEWFEFVAQVASASGAVAWLAIQQFASNPYLAHFDAKPWPTIGGAVGHLRSGKIDVAPTWRDGRISGRIPWFSGAGIFKLTVLGFFLPDGREAYAVVDASDRAEFAHGEPAPLFGCPSTCNVSIEISNLELDEDRFLQVEPAGSRSACDDVGVLNQVPLSLGVCRRCVELMTENPCILSSQVERAALRVDDLTLEILEECGKPTDLARRHHLRGEATELSMKLARIAAMATLPGGLMVNSTAARLYREALFFACVGGQNQVLSTAIDLAFPARSAAIRLETVRSA
jgi:hypothetical protein